MVMLIDPDCNLLYSFYHSNQGNPVSIVLPQLREIYALPNAFQFAAPAVERRLAKAESEGGTAI